ncbi:ABC transporter permease [Rhodocyclus tenuis]|uniref:FtsX-like permease family protein n=2 Tax=Rhodocyclus TaxID=1064 RepID=A0A6L5JYK7_RHOTE|nr:ABC transporter permease [Rhodocyclus gracilis]MQY51744.1 FtsX-like permease family protein [Rhodocyclus gracilis]MRD73224.1 FtsX-like permease family protein [Rhodocyclus gracilis]NJA88995.1 ABC transporter permease [Rhodocyclus gracilis]
MQIPLAYSLRNLRTRVMTTALTAGGMALVVFVFAAVLMLDEGLKRTLVDTGEPDNVVVTRRASGSEVQSAVERVPAAIVESLPQVAMGGAGERLISKESVVLITLNKRGREGELDKPSNVIIRGVDAMGFTLRPQVKIVAGRMFHPGVAEIVVARGVAERFENAGLGDSLRFGGREWAIVGLFDAGQSGFDSEIWGDADQLMQAFRRPVFSSLIFRLTDPSQFDAAKEAIESDPRLMLEAKRERVFYTEQSETLATFIRILGLSLSVIFSIGAIIGAMITMYAAVASRTAEIGTLRAIGFRRRSILLAFLLESLLLSLLGGLVGLAAASCMQLISLSTTNFQSFAELAFTFELTPRVVVKSLLFALFMGFIGGVLPAARAARMNIVDALRAA